MENLTCECPVAGFCHRYQREMIGRTHAICAGTVLSPEKQAAYRANWAKLLAAKNSPPPPARMTVVRISGPTLPAPPPGLLRPVGSDAKFTDAEWRALPPEHRRYYRALRKVKNAQQQVAQPTPALSIPEVHPCIHRGAELRRVICEFCGNRGKTVPIFACGVWDECSAKPYRAGQMEAECRGCPQYNLPIVQSPPCSSSWAVSSSNF